MHTNTCVCLNQGPRGIGLSIGVQCSNSKFSTGTQRTTCHKRTAVEAERSFMPQMTIAFRFIKHHLSRSNQYIHWKQTQSETQSGGPRRLILVLILQRVLSHVTHPWENVEPNHTEHCNTLRRSEVRVMFGDSCQPFELPGQSVFVQLFRTCNWFKVKYWKYKVTTLSVHSVALPYWATLIYIHVCTCIGKACR